MFNINRLKTKLLYFVICFVFFFTIYMAMPINSFDKPLKVKDYAYYSIVNQFGFYRGDLPMPTSYYIKTIVVLQLFTAFVIYII